MIFWEIQIAPLDYSLCHLILNDRSKRFDMFTVVPCTCWVWFLKLTCMQEHLTNYMPCKILKFFALLKEMLPCTSFEVSFWLKFLDFIWWFSGKAFTAVLFIDRSLVISGKLRLKASKWLTKFILFCVWEPGLQREQRFWVDEIRITLSQRTGQQKGVGLGAEWSRRRVKIFLIWA